MKESLSVYTFALLLLCCSRVQLLPLDADGAAVETDAAPKAASTEDEGATSSQAPEDSQTELSVGPREDINAASLVPDQLSVGGYDQSGNSADAFQQYYNKFNTAYSPFYSAIAAPFPAAYPAPAGYSSQLPYHAPYVVQTDYEGYLLPSPNIDAAAATSVTSSPLAYLRSLAAALMTTTVFRVIAAIVSAIGVIFFGGAITSAICSFTPLCDISFKAVTYLRRRDSAEKVAKTIVEEIASERVRRATDLVWKAIRKYSEMQQSSGD